MERTGYEEIDAVSRLILFNKPYGVLSQFTDRRGMGGMTAPADGPRATLSDYIDVPGVYPAGRLDKDSEGLLILTDDGALQARISSPKHKTPKTYLAQVEGEPDDAALAALARGVTLNDGPTRPAVVRRIGPPTLWDRDPPVRYRKSVADSWIELTITEGRNRQVRRMTAAVGFPTLRLVRWRIGGWEIGGLGLGAWRSIA